MQAIETSLDQPHEIRVTRRGTPELVPSSRNRREWTNDLEVCTPGGADGDPTRGRDRVPAAPPK